MAAANPCDSGKIRHILEGGGNYYKIIEEELTSAENSNIGRSYAF